jgi:Glycosyl transferase family 2
MVSGVMSVPVDRAVKLVNVGTGQVLRANADGTVDEYWRRHSEDADQQWLLTHADSRKHQWHVSSVASGATLSDEMTMDTAGTAGRFRLIPVADQEYAIVSVVSGRAVGYGVDSSSYLHDPRQRWKILAVHQERPTRAVVTLVRDEDVFLPIWLRYYRQFFAPQDIYVLDHGGADKLADQFEFTRIPIQQPVFGAEWQREVIQYHQHDLVDRYDVVLFADADEIVAPDPRSGDLGDYLDSFDQDYVTCQGYEVLHAVDDEPAFDVTRPVLSQRSSWYRNDVYSKSLLARVPMLWHLGFHHRFDLKQNIDPTLYLIHLHRMDYGICLARHQDRAAFPRAAKDRANDWGYQNRITDPDGFRQWFYQDSCGSGSIEPETILPHWRELV